MVSLVRGRHRLFRWLFGAYALALIIATHWPRLGVPGAAAGSDKVVHFVAFLLWTLLAIAAGLVRPPLSRRSITRTALIAGAYASIDESLQLIPDLERQFSVWDWVANLGGVLAAYALALIVIRPEDKDPDILA